MELEKRIINKKEYDRIYLLAILFGIAFAIFMPYASADLGTFKQGDCVNIRVLGNYSAVNLTEVTNTNQTFEINEAMTLIGGQTFGYSFCNTSFIGEYTYSWNPIGYDCATINCGNSFNINSTGFGDNLTILYFLGIGALILLALAIYRTNYLLGFTSGTLLVLVGAIFLIYGINGLITVYSRVAGIIIVLVGLGISLSIVSESLSSGGYSGGED